jgi:quercetin dioxygenase-like cupin family protein
MIIKPEDFKLVYQKDGAEGHSIINNNEIEFVELKLNPGAEIALHSLPFQVYFYVIEGTGNLQIEETLSIVETNSLAICKAHAQRAWKNEMSEPLRLLVVKQLN